MDIAAVLLLMAGSVAVFWLAATYTQRCRPSRLQYAAAWIVSSVATSALWVAAYVAYIMVKSPVVYCGFQDSAPCSRWAFLQEQMEIWALIAFSLAIPLAAILSALVFAARAAWPAKVSDEQQRPCILAKRQMEISAGIAAISLPYLLGRFGSNVTPYLTIVGAAAGAWVIAGKFSTGSTSPSERTEAWLKYAFVIALACPVIVEIISTVHTLVACDANPKDPRCIERSLSMILFGIGSALWFTAALYLIPVLALTRTVMLMRMQIAAGHVGRALRAAAVFAAVVFIFGFAADHLDHAFGPPDPKIEGWGPLKFGMSVDETVNAIPSISWFDRPAEKCNEDWKEQNECQLDALPNAGHLSFLGIPWTPTLHFNRRGELKSFELEAADTIERRDECLALADRALTGSGKTMAHCRRSKMAGQRSSCRCVL